MSNGTVKLQLRVLYRQFLLPIVDLELLAPKGDVTKLLGQFAALLVIVCLWLGVIVAACQSGAACLDPSRQSGALVAMWAVEHFLIAARPC